MGTMIQDLKLDEAGFRGERFKDWQRDVRGNNDLLILTQPDAIRDIHLAYFLAGADIVETNTFSSTRIAQADYGMEALAYELNVQGAKLAKEAAALRRSQGRQAALCRRRHRPDQPHRLDLARRVQSGLPRDVTFDELREAYGEQINGLLDGGADLLLIETIFDTLNAKAALYAIAEITEARGVVVPRDDLRHHHRPVGPASLRADAGSVLEFYAPRRAGLDRAQLRPRRQGDARPYRRARPHRRHPRLRLSECRPAQRIRAL